MKLVGFVDPEGSVSLAFASCLVIVFGKVIVFRLTSLTKSI
ncbi:unnamed protein product [Brassica napus]|uniref:(rape) hypothetical protein n=1 Tax=Brassica napus TaxID=3708 RepID=A0A816MG55_BRANA|nr:unnamed protein product [Brassica napus]